jgi:hypothetical protein
MLSGGATNWKEGAVVVVGGNVDGDNDSLPL